ncbi:MAG: family 16 glycoside hydrolase [Prosthecobacter sp.]
MKPTTALLFLSLAFSAFAEKPQKKPIGTAETLIVSTAFDQPTPPTRKGQINGWQAGIGEWSVKDGALHGDELAENNHPSSCTYRMEATDMILTAQFRLGTATQIAFACRDTVPPNNHLGRTFISKDAIWVTRMSGISKTTKSEKLAELKTPIDPEAWHTITIDIIGDHYRATVDGHVVEAHHERYKDAKGIVALVNKGQGAQFKNVSIWHAKPKK